MMRRFMIAAALSAAVHPAAAQGASTVPASHPVYDWLLQQRVAGRLPAYEHEVRPTSRSAILRHLRTIDSLSGRIGPFNRGLLDDFLREFDTRRLVANRLFTRDLIRDFPGSIIDAVRARRDPVIYAAFSADSVMSGALYKMETSGSFQLKEVGANDRKFLAGAGGRAFLNVGSSVGAHFEYDRVYGSGAHDLIARSPRYGTRALKPGEDGSFTYESWFSYRSNGLVELDLGRGMQALGAAVTDPLVLRPDAPFVGSARLRISVPRVSYTQVVSQLFAEPTVDTITYGGRRVPVNRAPTRNVVFQRLSWRVNDRLTLTAQEHLIWANRGLVLNYLVPGMPLIFMQNGDGDQDNLLVGAEAVWRPVNGTELLASFLTDDASIGGPYVKVATFGVEQSVAGFATLAASYTGSDPWMYTHRFGLTIPEHERKPLGPELGPNGEEWAARATAWFPLRTRLMVGYRRIKRGLNPVDAAGNQTANVGGDLLQGNPTTSIFLPRYQGADVHEISRRELALESEFIRGINVSVKMRDDSVTRGAQLPSSRFIEFLMRFGY